MCKPMTIRAKWDHVLKRRLPFSASNWSEVVDIDNRGVRRDQIASVTFAAIMLESSSSDCMAASALCCNKLVYVTPTLNPAFPKPFRQKLAELFVTLIQDVVRAASVRRAYSTAYHLPHTSNRHVLAIDVAALDLLIEDRRPVERNARHNNRRPAIWRVEASPSARSYEHTVG